MPTLTVRTVGMSYLIEGLVSDDINGIAMANALESLHGMAVATMCVPRTADPACDPGNSTIAGILIDRRATSSEALRDWIEAWLVSQGATYTAWVSNSIGTETSATLHFYK